MIIDPFAGVDLATVGDAADTVESMRKLAEAAETDQFNPAIDAATGADADALSNGKIKNKVLKLTGEVQAIKIKARPSRCRLLNSMLTRVASLRWQLLRQLVAIRLASRQS